jgi:hypothetical protein
MATVFGCPENIRVRLLKPTPRQLNVILKPIKVKDIHIDYEPMRDVGTGINRRHLPFPRESFGICESRAGGPT